MLSGKVGPFEVDGGACVGAGIFGTDTGPKFDGNDAGNRADS